MRKFFFLLIFFLLSFKIFTASAFSLTTPIHSLIKDEIIKQTSKMFRREISIGEVSGILVNFVTLKDIKIAKNKKLSEGNIIYIKEARIHYDAVKAGVMKDIIPAISEIELIDPFVYVEHDKNGKWNLFKLVEGDGGGTPPPQFLAKVFVRNGNVRFTDHLSIQNKPLLKKFEEEASKINGIINLTKKNKLFFKCTADIEKSSVYAEGKIDLKTQKTDIKIAAKKVSLDKWNPYIAIPVVKDVNLLGDANVNISTSISERVSLDGNIAISNAKIYNRNVAGQIDVSIAEDKISVNISKAMLSSGQVFGKLFFDASKKDAILEGRISFSNVDLSSLSNKLYETNGKMNGSIKISGRASDAKINGNFDITDGSILGQSADKISVDSNINKEGVLFNIIEISNGGSKIYANGTLNKNFALDLDASSEGFELDNAGLGSFGQVNKFNGSFSAVINKDFLKDPIPRINAKGNIMLADATIKNQDIDFISAEAEFKNSSLRIKHLTLSKNNSLVEMKGDIGFGENTNFELSCQNGSLSDFEILNEFLPEEARGISGRLNANLAVWGTLPKYFKKNDFGFLAQLSAKGEVLVLDGSIAGTKIEKCEVNLDWKNRTLFVDKFEIKTEKSHALVKGSIDKNNKINLPFDFTLDLLDLRPFTQKFAKIMGKTKMEGKFGGSIEKPTANFEFSGENLTYNNILIDSLSGKIKYEDNTIRLFGPSKLSQGDDEYFIVLNSSLFAKEPDLDIKFFTKNGGLISISQIAQMAYLEIIQRRGILAKKSKQVILNEKEFILPKKASFKSNLELWEKIESSARTIRESFHPFQIKTDGKMSIYIDFKIKKRKIEAKADVYSNTCSIGECALNDLLFSGEIKNNSFLLNNFSFKKGNGAFLAYGKADFNGAADFDVSIKSMPLDSIDTAVNLGIPVKGILNLDSKVSGALKSPKITAEFYVTKGEIRDIFLDGISGKIKFIDNILNIERFDVYSGKQRASLTGSAPFDSKRQLNLKLDLTGENVGLLLSLFKGVKWTKGAGKAKISLTGKITAPKVNGYFVLNDAEVSISQLNSSLMGLSIDISANNNQVFIKNCSGFLKGERTLGKFLPFSIAGNVNLNRIFGNQRIADLDLKAADFYGSIDIPNFYYGDFFASQISLKGSLPLKQTGIEQVSPMLSGSIALYDGRISLPKKDNGAGPKKTFPIKFDITANLGRNLNFFQGEESFLSLDVSKIDVIVSAENLRISGYLSAPQILGDVNINSGLVGVTGRDFELISIDSQEKFFANDRNLVQINTASFKGGSGINAVTPDLSITAKSEVTLDETVSQNEGVGDSGKSKELPKKEKATIITKISGMPYNIEKPVSLRFFAFKEDKSASPPQITALPYGENEIRIMLLPDFVKGTLGLSKGGVPIEMSAMAVDYLNSRLQAYLIKGLSANIEKALGLENFTLEYNFGRDLERYIPTRRSDLSKDENSQLAVGFAKGFFDRIYIQLRYAQSTNQTSLVNATAINYQITWKISRYYSFVYYREPITFQDQNSTYYKLTLQSLYKF